MAIALLLVATYLAGSLNVAIVVLRLAGHRDPRSAHSGNPGVSNVARMAGRPLAALVLLLDLSRAVAVHLLALRFGGAGAVAWAGLTLIAANRFPLWHRLRGGKGVANYLGFVAAGHPLVALSSCVAWLALYGLTRITVVASMVMLAVLALVPMLLTPPSALSALATALTSALIVLGHGPNFKALRDAPPPSPSSK